VYKELSKDLEKIEITLLDLKTTCTNASMTKYISKSIHQCVNDKKLYFTLYHVCIFVYKILYVTDSISELNIFYINLS